MIVEHPLSIIRLYREKWIRDKFSIERETLARLRLEEGLKNQQLAHRFGISLTSVKTKLYGLDRTGTRLFLDLSKRAITYLKALHG